MKIINVSKDIQSQKDNAQRAFIQTNLPTSEKQETQETQETAPKTGKTKGVQSEKI